MCVCVGSTEGKELYLLGVVLQAHGLGEDHLDERVARGVSYSQRGGKRGELLTEERGDG